jgi:hypothetical protein
MPRYTQVIENDDGWSDWIQPLMSGYRMACCDCGLVHEMDFRIENTSAGEARVQFRASRHSRATAAKRLWRRRAALNTPRNTSSPQT